MLLVIFGRTAYIDFIEGLQREVGLIGNREVLYPNTVYFKDGKNADYYIDLAGGATSTAKKSKTIIIYMNGMVARADRKHKPRPGCQIVVPTKKQRRGLGLQEWLSIGTSTASLGTMIATIANLTK